MELKVDLMSKMTAMESCINDLKRDVRKIKMKRVGIGIIFNNAGIFCLNVYSVEWFRWKN